MIQPTSCPCELAEPCHKDCSCANPVRSRGCRRCCKYGSLEQRRAMAEIFVKREAYVAEAFAAAKALLRRLEECKKDIDDRFAFAQNHGVTYAEAGYGAEYDRLKAATEPLREDERMTRMPPWMNSMNY